MRFLFLLLAFLTSIANSQTIDLIVSASPGGPTDTVSRKIAQIVETNSNINLPVFNKPGAAHTIAYNHILNTTRPTIIISTPEVQKHPVYSQLNPVLQLGKFSIHIFANSKSTIKTRKDIDNANREILFGHSGENTYSYIGLQEICANIKCLPVGYKSGAEGMLGVLTNQVDLYALVSFGSKSFIENDKLRIVTTLRSSNNYLTVFSKNIPQEKSKEIHDLILKHLDKKFLKDMGFEVND